MQQLFSQPWNPPNPTQFYNPAQFFPNFQYQQPLLTYPSQSQQFFQQPQPFPYAARGPIISQSSSTTKQPKINHSSKVIQLPTSSQSTISKEDKFCTHCQRKFHTAEECFALHPDLLQQYRERKRISGLVRSSRGSVNAIEGKPEHATAMIIIGAVTTKGTPLYMCQDTGASLNGTTIAVARKEGLRLTKMQSPMIALLGNGEEIQATYKTQLKFLYKNRQFTVPCFVFIIGTAFLYERQAIIVFKILSTYIRDNEGERVEFNNYIGELNQKVKAEYAVVLAEDVTLYPMSTHSFSLHHRIRE